MAFILSRNSRIPSSSGKVLFLGRLLEPLVEDCGLCRALLLDSPSAGPITLAIACDELPPGVVGESVGLGNVGIWYAGFCDSSPSSEWKISTDLAAVEGYLGGGPLRVECDSCGASSPTSGPSSSTSGDDINDRAQMAPSAVTARAPGPSPLPACLGCLLSISSSTAAPAPAVATWSTDSWYWAIFERGESPVVLERESPRACRTTGSIMKDV